MPAAVAHDVGKPVWNEALTDQYTWKELCIGAIGHMRQATHKRFRKQPEGPDIDIPQDA